MIAALSAVFLGAVDLTVISTVLPKIVNDLQINTADLDRYIWVVNGYLLAYIVAIPIVGRLSDIAGRRNAFEAALALFLAGSIWSGFASSLGELIAARALQGAGGGALLPIAMAVAGDLFPPGERTTALGIVGAVDTLGWVLGPIWGAAILTVVGNATHAWRWVFWLNVPVILFVAVVIHVKLPPRGERASGQRLDIVGALLLGGCLLLLNLGLSSGGEAGVSTGSAFRALGGTTNPLADHLLLLLGGGLLLFALLLVWFRVSPAPLVPLTLIRNRRFGAAQIANLLVGASLISAMVDVPLVAALVATDHDVSEVSALLLAPFTLFMAATSFAGGIAARRFGVRETGVAGLLAVIVGFVGMWAGLRHDHYWWMIPGLAVAGAGFGLVVAPIGSSAIEEATGESRGIAAASTIVFRLLGMTVSLSALTSFGIHRLQALSDRVDPIVRNPDESTADFLLRQNDFIQSVAIPIAVRVVRETFLLSAVLAALAIVPVLALARRRADR